MKSTLKVKRQKSFWRNQIPDKKSNLGAFTSQWMQFMKFLNSKLDVSNRSLRLLGRVGI